MMIRARTRTYEAQTSTVLHFIKNARFWRLRGRIIMKINMVVDIHTDSLSFKFYEDPFFGCREIAEINMSMDYSHF